MKNFTLIGLALVGLGLMGFASSRKKPMNPPVRNPRLRRDPAGDGRYGARRSGGRKHQGIDFIVQAGEPIYAPISGRITRAAYPYAGEPQWQGLVLEGSFHDTPYQVKMFYMIPTPGIIGQTVAAGQQIGTAQAISQKYGNPQMLDHLHLEVRQLNPADTSQARLIDPTGFFTFNPA